MLIDTVLPVTPATALGTESKGLDDVTEVVQTEVQTVVEDGVRPLVTIDPNPIVISENNNTTQDILQLSSVTENIAPTDGNNIPDQPIKKLTKKLIKVTELLVYNYKYRTYHDND